MKLSDIEKAAKFAERVKLIDKHIRRCRDTQYVFVKYDSAQVPSYAHMDDQAAAIDPLEINLTQWIGFLNEERKAAIEALKLLGVDS